VIGKMESSTTQNIEAGRETPQGRAVAAGQLPAANFLDAAFRRRAALRAKVKSASPSARQAGFTLLELMIVISIIIILAIIVLPQYQRTVLQARESVLKDDLAQMRKLIDQYAADKGQLPQSLDDLSTSGYLREVPVDPITQEKDWNVITGPDPNSAEGGQGVIDVRSASGDQSTEGSVYSDW
jgi:general secretion pathway protein G